MFCDTAYRLMSSPVLVPFLLPPMQNPGELRVFIVMGRSVST